MHQKDVYVIMYKGGPFAAQTSKRQREAIACKRQEECLGRIRIWLGIGVERMDGYIIVGT